LTEVRHNPAGSRAVDAAAGAPDGDLFSQAAEADTAEPSRPAVDESAAAMDRLRTPFDAGHAEPRPSGPQGCGLVGGWTADRVSEL